MTTDEPPLAPGESVRVCHPDSFIVTRLDEARQYRGREAVDATDTRALSEAAVRYHIDEYGTEAIGE